MLLSARYIRILCAYQIVVLYSRDGSNIQISQNFYSNIRLQALIVTREFYLEVKLFYNYAIKCIVSLNIWFLVFLIVLETYTEHLGPLVL